MAKRVTIVITPRDRFSGIDDCIAGVYRYTDASLFDLIVLDLGYADKDLKKIHDQIDDKCNARLIQYGPMIPMQAMDKVRTELEHDYTVFLDNDSRVTDSWLEPILKTADESGCAVIYPVTLERSGVDEGEEIRNHLFTTEIRAVDVDGEDYLIEHKTFRRSPVDELPDTPTETEAFEFHCVMFRTSVLNDIEIPHMTIREHLDIGMQLKARGEKLLVDPASRIVFDNLGTRAELADLKFFNLRWNSRTTYQSSRLFEKRWGYKWYAEESIYNWAIRRRLFLLLRWMHLPIGAANAIDRVFSGIRRRVSPIWDPLDKPNEKSVSLYKKLGNKAPRQLDTASR